MMKTNEPKNIIDYSVTGRELQLDNGMLEHLAGGRGLRFIDEDSEEIILIIRADPRDGFRFKAAVKASNPLDE
jgi:hypothetical protein